MVNLFTRALGRLRPDNGYKAARVEAPMAYFFDGKSFAPMKGNQPVERFSGYGMSAATLRPGKLQQSDWDYARAYVQCEYAFRCVEMVAADIASIKHGVRHRSTKEDWPDHPLMLALAWARRAMRQDIISLWEKALYVFGESYLLPISNGFNDPKTGLPYYNGLQWLNPLATEPRIISGQLICYDYTTFGVYSFKPSEIVHDKFSSMFDDLRGQSPMAAALAAINIDIEIKRYTLDSFIKDMRMSGILTGREGSMLSQKDIDAALDVISKKRESRLIGLAPALVWQQVQHEWNDSQFKASDDARRRITTALGIPMSVVGAWDDAHYQSAPAQLEFYYDKVVFRECDRMTQFIEDVLMPYFDPYGEGEFYYDKDSVHMPGEDKAAKTNIANSRQAAGNLTLNEVRKKLGDPPIEGGDIFIINGTIISKNQLAQMALQPPAPLLPTEPTPTAPVEPPALPAPAPEKAIEPTEQPGMKSAFIGLTFPNHPDLMSLQSRVKELVGAGQCEWNTPDEFHITLAYAPAVTDEQLAALAAAIADVDVPDMALRVGSLGVFDNLGQHAVHFKIRRNTDLVDLQSELYELCDELGIPMSSFSRPEQYKPHITMGYATDKLPPITFKSALKVTPSSMCLKAGDKVLHERMIGKAAPTPDEVPVDDATNHEMAAKGALCKQDEVGYTIHSGDPVKMCRNCRWFSNQPNSMPCNIVWDAPLTIVEEGLCNRWEPIPDGSTVNAWIEDYEPDNPNLVPELVPPEAQDEQDELAAGKALDRFLDDAGLVGILPRTIKGQLSAPKLDDGSTPTDEPQTIHAAALDELAAWQKKVKNKGAGKSIEFKNYLIRDELADQIRAVLRQEEAEPEPGSSDNIAATFQYCRTKLSVKSIQATRSGFEDDFSGLLSDALKGSISRRQFQGRLKSMIETYGYKAYIDGLRDGGVDDDPSSDESATVVDMIAAQGEYITSLGKTIYKDENAVISEAVAEQKSTIWYNKSINPFYLAGLAEADANGLYEWVYGDTEHCEDCRRLNGQKHRMKEYTSKGILPKADTLACGGFNCKCSLVKASGRAKGSW